MRIAIAAVAILAASAAAAADTIRVPQDFGTIQDGVTAADTGDTVSISKGVYFENVVVGTAGIKIVGKGAILDGNISGVDGVCLTVNAADVVVQGLTFRHGTDQISVAADGLQVSKCTFLDANSDSIVGSSNTAIVTSSKFAFMSSDGIDLIGNTITVSKCTFSRGGTRGLLLTGNGNRVESCTFTGMDDGGAAFVDGDAGYLGKNKATFLDGDAFRIDGNTGVIESNKADRCDSRLVLVNGDGVTVQKNTGTYMRGGIDVTGDGAMVLSNKFTNTAATDAIFVEGDGFTISKNTVSTTYDEADGIEADSATVAGLGTIEGNKVSDTAGWGYNLDTVFGVVVRDNSATRCGQDGRGGVNLVGDDNTLDGLKVTDVEGPGIVMNGVGNDSLDCAVKTASTDGFRVLGNLNNIDRCSATACGGEGLDNRGTGTIVGNSKFTKNRIDVANDVIGGATIPAGLGTVTFDTGGDATQPQVD